MSSRVNKNLYESLIATSKKYNPNANLDLLKLAYDYAELAHRGQLRKSGEPYINHALHTALTLAEIKADIPTIITGIIHDVPEDTDKTIEDVEKNFGSEIASLVRGITKLGKIKYRGIERYVENLKKMFIAAAADSRVMIIKFADRLHNLETLDALPRQKQKRIAQESLKIYAPIAGFLGVSKLRWRIEDLCFKNLYPREYEKLKRKYEIEQKGMRDELIRTTKKIVIKEAQKNNLKFEIEGRFKHFYSIWQKMERKKKEFNEIYDVFALRIIVDTIPDCYRMLGIIHNIFKPKKDRFKDYIAVPKPNGYRSLHTTVFGPSGRLIEFQIRTIQMQDEAQYGIAAHWRYKDAEKNPFKTESRWMEEIMEINKEAESNKDFIKKLELNIFTDRLFVFTPKGDVIDLPKDATPVDFSYYVHTDIGNHCIGAIVNSKMSPLDTKLASGDMVEIITDKNRKGPNLDWLKFVKTHTARARIRKYAETKGLLSSLIDKLPKIRK